MTRPPKTRQRLFSAARTISPASSLSGRDSAARGHRQHSLGPDAKAATVLTHSPQGGDCGFHLTQLTLQISLFRD